MGSGAGYGSYILSMVAKQVTGIDRDMRSAHWSAQEFQAGNLDYIADDIVTGQIPGADLYVAFEVLEHLDNPDQLVQRLDAPLVWSIPVEVPSQWHVRTYTIDDIDGLMGHADYAQSGDGDIVPRSRAWFAPAYMLGFTQ